MAIYAFDVDNVVFEGTIYKWVLWAGKQKNLSSESVMNLYEEIITSKKYHVESCFEQVGILNPMDFWKQSDLYDDQYPSRECLNIVREILGTGNEVVFVSDAFPGHMESKTKALKMWFGQDIPIFYGIQKQFIRCNFFIDDRPDTCKTVARECPNVNVIQYCAALPEINKIMEENVYVCYNWGDVRLAWDL